MAAKKNVVNHFGNSSLYVGEMFKDMGTTFKDGSTLPLSEYQGEGGSFPLKIRGQGKIGTITVSGLTGEEDHNLAVEGIKRFLSIKKP
ncbi:MAG: heme-binding protein [Ruminiclostridium sp.]